MAFNVVDILYKNYKQRFPDASMDNFLGYIKQNYPEQYNWARRFADTAQDYTMGRIDDLKELGNQAKENVQQKANTIKQNINQNTKVAQQRLEQALSREGLKKATTSTPKIGATAKNITKGGAKVASKAAGPTVAAVVDIPTTVGNWNAPGSDWISRGADVLGNIMTIGSVPALSLGVAPGLSLMAGGMGFHNLAQQRRDYNEGQANLNTNPLKELTPEQQQRYNQYVLTEANQLQNQLQNQMQQTQKAIDFYNSVDDRLNPSQFSPKPDIQEMNMRLPVAPTTGVNTSSNINRPVSNLTPVPGQSDASNQKQVGNINMSNQQPILPNNQQMANVIDNIQMLSSFARGLQSGNQLPNLGVSPDELQAYSNMLEQYGKNVSGLQQDVDAYRKALQTSVKNQAIATGLDALGNVLQATRIPKQNMYTFNMNGDFVGVGAPEDRSNLGNLGQGLRNMNQAQLDAFRTNMELQNSLRKAEQDKATQFADLLTGARLSSQTGLPLNVARNMSASDYINYIQPTQEARNEAQKIALQGVSDLITGGQQQAADYIREINTQALQDQGAYQREALGQLGQNQRAQLDALVRTNLNELDNRTKLQLEQMSGMNAQQLERLKQSDPNAFYRAIGPVLMAATYTTGPSSNLAGNYIYTLLNQLYPQGGQQSEGMTQAAQSYWNNFNR